MRTSGKSALSNRAPAILLFSAAFAFASNPAVDPKFRADAGANGEITEIALDARGRILVAGDFESFAGATRTNLVRLRSNGKPDQSFTPELALPAIYSIVVQPDRKILFGGYYGLYRLMPNGRLDESFDSGFAEVYALAIQADGKILIGQQPSTAFYRYQPLVRRNPDGSFDWSFDFSSEAYQTVFSILLRDDGRVLVGGTFYYVDDVIQPHLALANNDGSLDGSFAPEVGPTSVQYVSPYDIKLQPDGKIVIGGFFQLVGRQYRGNIARVNADGLLDPTFNPLPGPTNGFNAAVNSIALQPDGKILCAGDFTSFNGVRRNYLARLNADGSLDESFNAGMGPNGPLNKVLLLPKHRILIAGSFTAFDGIPQGNISRLIDTPCLTVRHGLGGALVLSWPAAYTNYVLQSVTRLDNTNWGAVANTPVLANQQFFVTNPIGTSTRFFRLVQEAVK